MFFCLLRAYWSTNHLCRKICGESFLEQIDLRGQNYGGMERQKEEIGKRKRGQGQRGREVEIKRERWERENEEEEGEEQGNMKI